MAGRAGTSSPETWDAFFSDFYLRAYAADEREGEAEAQALAAARLAACPEGGELLDVPCGFGRHSVALARAGYRVTGVDRSAALLDEARRRAGGERWPKWVTADYRELPFADASFDAAMNLFSSLGYLGDEEDTRVLAEIRRVLRPGARLVVELLHRDRLVRGVAEQDWRVVRGGGGPLAARTLHPPARRGAAPARAAHVRRRRRRCADHADADRRRRRPRVAHVLRPRLQRDRARGDARSRRVHGCPRLRRPRRVAVRRGHASRRGRGQPVTWNDLVSSAFELSPA